jgi:hypothetical protein
MDDMDASENGLCGNLVLKKMMMIDR